MRELDEARRTIRQSALVHPDWGPGEHFAYLVDDAFLDDQAALTAVKEWFVGQVPA